MKVIVIGCTHAGTAAIVNLKELYPDSDVVVYERNDNISFLSCGIALSIGGIVTETEKLFYNSPDNLSSLGVKTKMKHDVLDIDFDNKIVKVKNLENGEIFEDSYEKLVLTLGSWPIIPKFEGGNLQNILLCKNYNHAKEIEARRSDAKNVVVIGGGYIGVELAEAFKIQNKNVTLIDAEERIMSKYLDKEFTDIAENEFRNHGINLVLGEKVKLFKGDNDKVSHVVTDNNEYEADLVILCIGFAPSTALVKGKLETLQNGAIMIDEYMQTSRKDVFAAGDCCVVKFNPADDTRYIPLATNAVRMGTLIAHNIVEPKLKYMGTQGTSGIKIYEKCIASTGLTEEVAKNTTSFNVGAVSVTDNYRPEFMPTYEEALLKLVYDKDSRRILGGQIISNLDLTQFMNTLSVVIQNKMTIEELAMTDFFFQPHFNKPWSLLNIAALQALKNI
ncbi:FAD-dependent oxidoreductase [Clostridium beijerinckii]|jgi:NADPH-dependent 2,4-dienoyl-CoA reductase/sulfur reductase-like enzyme|uniref:FAD-dependent oxidoreductase n=2 Tax=Clostridium beijerinckii TaxID=1520 RepID=A0AAE2V0S8_CLOBE|nr:FAD-dependent oxidoreductase [Clostridium beijerinckii]ABR36124.1 FAD-dependent pyridine nucleotide-disulphide oxidoreductase [Clostridium beijerinckii NCIMB 8052]AIU02254.1 FAD-dependent pyridine nucleotide-disulfide oxidoreductase [Clostridium beijerinckii ATCC 35702]MBF7809228.1 FAD-dependent oxidoreductase [Clostridium beijerinckii]NRT22818.1 NADPH-dependent 2,4-dienoyl-CoA reductase/sulfur reductase-like enzyme [Clostridium beijerinckii]NRT64664.1 NADPH-dependent 2,4-dienoyl-CoA reduct